MFSTKDLEARAPTLLPSKAAPMIIFCTAGGRADEARKALRKLGYTGNLTNGGMYPDDMTAAVEQAVALQKAKKKKKGGCVIS